MYKIWFESMWRQQICDESVDINKLYDVNIRNYSTFYDFFVYQRNQKSKTNFLILYLTQHNYS